MFIKAACEGGDRSRGTLLQQLVVGAVVVPVLTGVVLLVSERVGGGRLRSQSLQQLGIEAVGELPADFDDLTGAAVVPQGPGHLLVGHGFAVALPPAPHLGHLLLVLGDELEDPALPVHPLDTVGHLRVTQGFAQELVQAKPLSAWNRDTESGSAGTGTWVQLIVPASCTSSGSSFHIITALCEIVAPQLIES